MASAIMARAFLGDRELQLRRWVGRDGTARFTIVEPIGDKTLWLKGDFDTLEAACAALKKGA